MIGDNLETDIFVAYRFGIHSMLIASGVHELFNPTESVILQDKLNELEKTFKVDANFVMSCLRW